jgi:SAM-dependent methyltransferase
MPSPELLALLRCPSCNSRLVQGSGNGSGDSTLTCMACGRAVPVIGGIARFVDVAEDGVARHTQASFGYEWTHFSDWRHSGETNFDDYFKGMALQTLRNAVVLDAGCGMGRHARQVAAWAHRVVAVDFSKAIEQAARNVEELGNVDCLQADLLTLPLADVSFDFVYSLGVLHHLERTEDAVAVLVRKLKPGGRLRVYLYWKRHGLAGGVLACVTAARRLTTKLPLGPLRRLCWGLSAALFAAVVLPYRFLLALGFRAHESWPLFVYTKYPFNVLYNDQFDRFSAPIEKRYEPHELKRLLEGAGLRDVQVHACFGWIGDGTKPK